MAEHTQVSGPRGSRWQGWTVCTVCGRAAEELVDHPDCTPMERCSICDRSVAEQITAIRIQRDYNCSVVLVCSPCIERILQALQAILHGQSHE